MRMACPLPLLAVLLSFLSVGTATHHIPARLSRPIFAPATFKRATSQDPSCPTGFLCEQEPCPSSAVCPSGEMCLNFEGTLACVPQDSSWCALNPDSFQGVGCWNGICWFVITSQSPRPRLSYGANCSAAMGNVMPRTPCAVTIREPSVLSARHATFALVAKCAQTGVVQQHRPPIPTLIRRPPRRPLGRRRLRPL